MNFADIIMPLFALAIVAFGLYKKTDVFSEFTKGAKEGFLTAFNILPSLLALLVAVKMLFASGALGIAEKLISPIAELLHFPPQLVPIALIRPVSGSGSLAVATDIFSRFGTDSFVGKTASVMLASSETTFYTVAVYFGAVSAKNVRHTLLCSLFADFVCAFISVVVCSLMF